MPSDIWTIAPTPSHRPMRSIHPGSPCDLPLSARAVQAMITDPPIPRQAASLGSIPGPNTLFRKPIIHNAPKIMAIAATVPGCRSIAQGRPRLFPTDGRESEHHADEETSEDLIEVGDREDEARADCDPEDRPMLQEVGLVLRRRSAQVGERPDELSEEVGLHREGECHPSDEDHRVGECESPASCRLRRCAWAGRDFACHGIAPSTRRMARTVGIRDDRHEPGLE